MRFESVTAHAFGPFLGKRLDLAPGMNVIFGPNESGKSTLHAAAFAALCGRRRGRGQPPKEEREFAERHRPWDGNEWSVSAVVTLEDGRRVELHHDLDGGVDCAATDVDLGRDYSAEIINDGAPDDPNVPVRLERIPDVGRNRQKWRSLLDLPVTVVLSQVPRVADPYRSARAAGLADVRLERVGRRERIGRVNARPESRREGLVEPIGRHCAHRCLHLLQQKLT